MMLHRIGLLCIIWLAAIAVPGAQSLHSRAQVRAEFADQDDIRWLHTFTGTWQSFHPVEITLGFDGSVYHGSMRCGEHTQFTLYGTHENGKAVLQEIDTTGRTSGYLNLSITDGRMTGEWWSTDFSRSAALNLRSETVVEIRRFAPELMVFNSAIHGPTALLILQREEQDLLSGFCMLGDQEMYRLLGTCEDASCDNMHLALTGANGAEKSLRCTRQRGTTYRLRFTGSDQQESATTLWKRFPIQVERSMDYLSSMDCTYPLTGMPAFDSWITTTMHAWSEGVTKYINQHLEVLGTPGPADRWSIRASAWTDITLITDQKVSGLFTMYHPEKGAYERTPFTFDIRSGKVETIQEFVRKPQFETLLKEDAARKLKGDSEKPFRHISLSHEGFVIFTDFDHLTGDRWVMLRYEDYVTALKRNTIIQDLMQ